MNPEIANGICLQGFFLFEFVCLEFGIYPGLRATLMHAPKTRASGSTSLQTSSAQETFFYSLILLHKFQADNPKHQCLAGPGPQGFQL